MLTLSLQHQLCRLIYRAFFLQEFHHKEIQMLAQPGKVQNQIPTEPKNIILFIFKNDGNFFSADRPLLVQLPE